MEEDRHNRAEFAAALAQLAEGEGDRAAAEAHWKLCRRLDPHCRFLTEA